MRVLVQRVLSASVSIAGETSGSIGKGLLLFVGLTCGDNPKLVQQMAHKAVNLRIFPDSCGRLQHSLIDVHAEILAVPQFTLYGSATRGRRPDFTQALEPEQATALFDLFVRALNQVSGNKVAVGKFGANMLVTLENDGPFTLMLDREPSQSTL